jgi:hypothetical protein
MGDTPKFRAAEEILSNRSPVSVHITGLAHRATTAEETLSFHVSGIFLFLQDSLIFILVVFESCLVFMICLFGYYSVEYIVCLLLHCIHVKTLFRGNQFFIVVPLYCHGNCFLVF